MFGIKFLFRQITGSHDRAVPIDSIGGAADMAKWRIISQSRYIKKVKLHIIHQFDVAFQYFTKKQPLSVSCDTSALLFSRPVQLTITCDIQKNTVSRKGDIKDII